MKLIILQSVPFQERFSTEALIFHRRFSNGRGHDDNPNSSAWLKDEIDSDL